MNILKEKKTLIEWEKELDIWLVDLDLKEHLNLFNKTDAFSKISISNFKRGWSRKHYDLYYTIMLNKSMDSLVLDEFKTCYKNECLDMYEERLLIEWEKEYNVWINDLDYNDHFRKYCRYQVDSKLKRYLSISKWNNDAQKIYDSYKGVDKDDNKDIQNEDENKKLVEVSKNGNAVQNVYHSVKVRKCKNRKKIKKSIVTKAVSIALLISTAVSAFICSKFSDDNSFDVTDHVYACDVKSDNSVENFENALVKNLDIMLNKKDNISLETSNEPIVNDCCEDLKQEVLLDKSSNDIDEEEVYFKIGDVVSINKDSNIYTNCIDAMNNSNGLDPYYSSDYDRIITGVCLNDDGNIVYSNDNDDINNYVNDGALVVSYSTMVDGIEEGFYGYDDIKVLKKQI